MYSVKSIKCHGYCENCYESRVRESSREGDFNVEAALDMMASLPNDERVTVHGGEPLLMPIGKIERLLKAEYDRRGATGIQTGLIGLSPRHVEMFLKYKTNVGISLDGHTAALNAGRTKFSPNPGQTHEEMLAAVEILRAAKVDMSSCLVVLRKYNAGDSGRLDGLKDFIRWLAGNGISFVRLMPESTFEGFGHEWLPRAFLEMLDFYLSDTSLASPIISRDPEIDYRPYGPKRVTIQPFLDIASRLAGYEAATCSRGGCDPWATSAEMTILADGSMGNCVRGPGGKDGILTLHGGEKTSIRDQMLQQVSQSNGGCKGCVWWDLCRGGCPGSGFAGDWRNRTAFCGAFKVLYERIASIISALFPNLPLLQIGAEYIKGVSGTWQSENRIPPDRLKSGRNGAEMARSPVDEGNRSRKHGDRPHGDHMDKSPEWRELALSGKVRIK